MTKISNQYSLTNILTADLANSRLGINNVSPTVALDVTGAGKFSSSVTAGAQVGITTTSTTAALQITLPSNANATILQSTGSNSGYGWKLQQEEVSTGDFRIFRREASVDYQVLNLARSTGAATFYGGGVVNIYGTSATNNTLQGYLDLRDGNGNELAIIRGYRGANGNAGILKIYTGVQAATLALTIDENQNVGIGTSLPATAGGAYTGIDIRGSGGGSLIMGSTSTLMSYFYADAGGLNIQTTGSIPILFIPGGSERMRITSGGEVQIGTTTVYGCKLNVNGDIFQISGSGGIYSNNFGVLNGGVDLKFAYNSSNSVLFTVGGVVKGSLTGAGVWSTTGGGTSDLRKKQNIEYIQTDGIESIKLLKPAKFEFKSNPEKTRRGFIAQDVLEVIPNLVLGDGELEGGTYGLDYDGILALAVKAIQELSAKVSLLENK